MVVDGPTARLPDLQDSRCRLRWQVLEVRFCNLVVVEASVGFVGASRATGEAGEEPAVPRIQRG